MNKAVAEAERVPTREEIPEEDKWDLNPLFKSDSAWEEALEKLERQISGFEQYRGRLAESPEVMRECFDFEYAWDQEAERVQRYVMLKVSENVADSTYQGMMARLIRMATQAHEAMSFMAPEIQAIPDETMQAFLESPELEPYRFTLEKLIRFKPHILSEPEERILAMQGEVAGTAERIFSQLNDADLEFGALKDETGQKRALTQSSFSSFLESPTGGVRKKAFHQFYEEYEAHANTLAASLSASVLQDVYQARVRKFPSSLEAALFADNIPTEVYHNLLDTVHDNLGKVYAYIELRKKILQLDELHLYDTYVPLVKMDRVHIPYEEAVDLICEALKPLGNQYVNTMRKGLLEKRWVDRYENEGKRSGAFSAGGYTGPPYILMNYRSDTYNGLFTLAHEAGHSMHTYFSARNQPCHYYDYTIFVAEVASTFNELLLSKYLMEHTSDDTLRAYLINKEIDEIRGTLVRQSMFAEFELAIHECCEAGEPLTLDAFRSMYHNLLEQYFGPGFTIDDELSLEGLRVPHFYHAFYVYKYATGISAAIALAEKVMHGGKAERDDYLGMLDAGGSKYPLDILRDAGVDMAKPEPVALAMQRLESLTGEFEGALQPKKKK